MLTVAAASQVARRVRLQGSSLEQLTRDQWSVLLQGPASRPTLVPENSRTASMLADAVEGARLRQVVTAVAGVVDAAGGVGSLRGLSLAPTTDGYLASAARHGLEEDPGIAELVRTTDADLDPQEVFAALGQSRATTSPQGFVSLAPQGAIPLLAHIRGFADEISAQDALDAAADVGHEARHASVERNGLTPAHAEWEELRADWLSVNNGQAHELARQLGIAPTGIDKLQPGISRDLRVMDAALAAAGVQPSAAPALLEGVNGAVAQARLAELITARAGLDEAAGSRLVRQMQQVHDEAAALRLTRRLEGLAA